MHRKVMYNLANMLIDIHQKIMYIIITARDKRCDGQAGDEPDIPSKLSLAGLLREGRGRSGEHQTRRQVPSVYLDNGISAPL